ncbi:MAG: hypothetical protein U0P45_10020 [Acidimicrobiales bacterium]
MRTDRPAHTKAALAAVLAASAILVAACGASGGSESSDGGGATTTAASDGGATTTTAAPRTTTTAAATTTTAAAEGGDLVGTWTADAQSILGANLANLGGNAGLACSGPVTLTFNDDGTFTHKSQATCSRGSISPPPPSTAAAATGSTATPSESSRHATPGRWRSWVAPSR